MYKDKARQREANRRAAKKYRDSMTGKGMTVSPKVIPESDIRVIPESKGLKAELAKRYPSLTVMERLFYRPASKLGSGETNFVSLPGRACYGVYE